MQYRSEGAAALQAHLSTRPRGERISPRSELCREFHTSNRQAQALINEALEAGFLERGPRYTLVRTGEQWWADLVAVPSVGATGKLWRIVVCGGGKTKAGRKFKRVWSWYYEDGEAAVAKYRRLLASKRGCQVRLERVALAAPWQVVDSDKQEYLPKESK